jgi:hypothetical protein
MMPVDLEGLFQDNQHAAIAQKKISQRGGLDSHIVQQHAFLYEAEEKTSGRFKGKEVYIGKE